MIYVSRYQNPELRDDRYRVVQITLGRPRFVIPYKIVDVVPELAPDGSMFHLNDPPKFERLFCAKLDRVGIDRITTRLQGIADAHPGKDVVLCCFEDVRKPGPAGFCHRSVFARWFQRQAGIQIPELPDPSPIKEEMAKKVRSVQPRQGDFFSALPGTSV